MGKPRIANQKKKYEELKKRLLRYQLIIQSVYDTLANDTAKYLNTYGVSDSSAFSFKDYPHVSEAVDGFLDDFVNNIRITISRGTSDEWNRSNAVQDLIVNKVLKSYGATVHGEKYNVYYQTNPDSLKAFQERTDNGLNLSQKLWKQSDAVKNQLERCISTAIQKGTSAVTLSKQLSKYLNDFPSMQKDYKELYGNASDIEDCEYRSIRLARSEINMSYRTAEQKRWSQMDFVLGYEIKTSSTHTNEDICDELQGVYPKDFDWVGWHPNCMCYEVPVLMNEDDFWNDNVKPDIYVTEMPQQFTEWINNNSDRISNAQERDTLPYWLRDNTSKWSI